jgi:hypothetical protein
MEPTDVIIGLFLIFGLIVYMVCIVPSADSLIEVMTPSDATAAENQQFAHRTAVYYIPVVYGFGILVWGFAAATKTEGYNGYR